MVAMQTVCPMSSPKFSTSTRWLARLRFADQDGQTLVIVTADHETGGLSLLDGSIPKGYVSGQFSTNDHTGIPVPVFAYGPGAEMFRGVYENTELFRKMLRAMGLSPL